MDYMTVKEAGERWGLGIRIVTLYCAEGRINDAVKKGNLWLIPQNASKPADGRRKKILQKDDPKKYQDASALYEQRQDMKVPFFQSLYENKELFVEIIQHFPFPCTYVSRMEL